MFVSLYALIHTVREWKSETDDGYMPDFSKLQHLSVSEQECRDDFWKLGLREENDFGMEVEYHMSVDELTDSNNVLHDGAFTLRNRQGSECKYYFDIDNNSVELDTEKLITHDNVQQNLQQA